MAIIGGGPPPLGSGNSFTGSAESIELVGDHCYAYAGSTGATTSEDTRLKFTSGNYYVVGEFTYNGASSPTGDGNITAFTVTLNGSTIAVVKVDTSTEDMPASIVNPIVIPPYTEVEVSAQSDGASGTRLTSVQLTGRIYRG